MSIPLPYNEMLKASLPLPPVSNCIGTLHLGAKQSTFVLIFCIYATLHHNISFHKGVSLG
jgi:hypothetical protein